MAFGYDWTQNVYELDFEKEFEIPFKGVGWYQCRGDMMLVENTGTGNALNSLYRVYVVKSTKKRELITEENIQMRSRVRSRIKDIVKESEYADLLKKIDANRGRDLLKLLEIVYLEGRTDQAKAVVLIWEEYSDIPNPNNESGE